VKLERDTIIPQTGHHIVTKIGSLPEWLGIRIPYFVSIWINETKIADSPKYIPITDNKYNEDPIYERRTWNIPKTNFFEEN